MRKGVGELVNSVKQAPTSTTSRPAIAPTILAAGPLIIAAVVGQRKRFAVGEENNKMTACHQRSPIAGSSYQFQLGGRVDIMAIEKKNSTTR
jgi:hypothetical protein